MGIQEMRALCHPTRARILERLKSAPATRSELTKAAGAPLGEVAYHCRALCRSGCAHYAPSSGPEASDPVFEAA